MSKLKQEWQKAIDNLGEDWTSVLRILCYIGSGWYGLMAILSPFSEYVFIGRRNFYELWQKLCFGAGAATMSFGLYKLGRSYQTTSQRSRF